MKKASTDLSVIRAAFKKMNKGNVVALCNSGITASAGWEDVSAVVDERGGDEKKYSMIFWHNQSHDAFDRAGNLIGTLSLHWAGDRLKLEKLLKEHLGSFQVNVPRSKNSTFTLQSAPVPVAEIDVKNRVQSLRFLDAIREDHGIVYTDEQKNSLRGMIREGEPKVMIYAVLLLESSHKLLDATDVANLLRRFEEIIKLKPGRQTWQDPRYAIKFLLDAMARIKHADYDKHVREWGVHKKDVVRAGVADHFSEISSPLNEEQKSVLKKLLNDPKEPVHFAGLYALFSHYQKTGKERTDAYFDSMLAPDASRHLIRACVELLHNYNESWSPESPVNAKKYASQFRKLAESVSDEPELKSRLLELM
jgi:hypothetical protein